MTSSGSNSSPAAKPSVWSRFNHYILHPDLTPENVAWSFAIGLSIAWNPIIGTHTWIALAFCFFIKNLHRPLLLLATFLNNPLTMVPIASASAFLGNWLLGRGWMINLSGISWKSIGISSFTSCHSFYAMYSMLKPILTPYLLGGFIVSFLAIPIGYWFMLWLSKKSRKLRKKYFHERPIVEQNHQPPADV